MRAARDTLITWLGACTVMLAYCYARQAPAYCPLRPASCLLFIGYFFCGSPGPFYSVTDSTAPLAPLRPCLADRADFQFPSRFSLHLAFSCHFRSENLPVASTSSRRETTRCSTRPFPDSAKRSRGCAARLHRTRSFSRNRMTHSSCSERRDGKRCWSTAFLQSLCGP